MFVILLLLCIKCYGNSFHHNKSLCRNLKYGSESNLLQTNIMSLRRPVNPSKEQGTTDSSLAPIGAYLSHFKPRGPPPVVRNNFDALPGKRRAKQTEIGLEFDACPGECLKQMHNIYQKVLTSDEVDWDRIKEYNYLVRKSSTHESQKVVWDEEKYVKDFTSPSDSEFYDSNLFEHVWVKELFTYGARLFKDVKVRAGTNPVLVVVDMQIDFISGTFQVSEADNIVQEIANIVKVWNPSGTVVATRDYHPSQNKSFKPPRNFLPHCLIPATIEEEKKAAMQDGSLIHKTIADALEERAKKNYKTKIVYKGMAVRFDSYGAFPYLDTYAPYNRTHQCDWGKGKQGGCGATLTGSFEYKGRSYYGTKEKKDESSSECFDDLYDFPSNSDLNSESVEDGHDNAWVEEGKFTNDWKPKFTDDWKPFDAVSRCVCQNGATVVVVGVCLTFCVLDTAVNLKMKRDDLDVYICIDLTRAANVPSSAVQTGLLTGASFIGKNAEEYIDPRGYINTPPYFYAICKKHNIKLCLRGNLTSNTLVDVKAVEKNESQRAFATFAPSDSE